jgi:hypothetical protein
MSMSPTATATARRNLSQRIARLTDAIEKQGRQPNRIEGERMRDALGNLAVDQFPGGEEAMLRAERACNASPHELGRVHAGDESATVQHIRQQLRRIIVSTKD